MDSLPIVKPSNAYDGPIPYAKSSRRKIGKNSETCYVVRVSLQHKIHFVNWIACCNGRWDGN